MRGDGAIRMARLPENLLEGVDSAKCFICIHAIGSHHHQIGFAQKSDDSILSGSGSRLHVCPRTHPAQHALTKPLVCDQEKQPYACQHSSEVQPINSLVNQHFTTYDAAAIAVAHCSRRESRELDAPARCSSTL